MRVTVFHCGPAANDSERKALDRLRRGIEAELGDGAWTLLANLSFSVTHRLQSDEIDIVAIGPPGARVIEVKHWADRHRPLLEDEADRVAGKARKIGTTLRRTVPGLPRVGGAILLTQEPSRARKLAAAGPARGVGVHTLAGWKDAIGLDNPDVLSPPQLRALAAALAPKAQAAADGTLKRLAGYADLALRSPREERWRRIYKAVHATRRDRAILHLYDLSASGDEKTARREHEAIIRLQRHAWAPLILDTWQDAPGYAGEMFFFAIADPAAPTLADRANDESWPPEARAHYARNAAPTARQWCRRCGLTVRRWGMAQALSRPRSMHSKRASARNLHRGGRSDYRYGCVAGTARLASYQGRAPRVGTISVGAEPSGACTVAWPLPSFRLPCRVYNVLFAAL